MRKASFLLLSLIVTAAFAGAQVGEDSRAPEPNLTNAVPGSALTCSPPRRTFVVPERLVPRARLKAKLLVLLGDSLFDDTRGVVNITREKEIKKLANKLRNERDDY